MCNFHVQGSGKQQRGALINLVAFYVFALPVALFLGFYMGWGVMGLFAGMGLGPLVQSLLYGTLVAKMDWGKEANRAATLAMKVQQFSTLPSHLAQECRCKAGQALQMEIVPNSSRWGACSIESLQYWGRHFRVFNDSACWTFYRAETCLRQGTLCRHCA